MAATRATEPWSDGARSEGPNSIVIAANNPSALTANRIAASLRMWTMIYFNAEIANRRSIIRLLLGMLLKEVDDLAGCRSWIFVGSGMDEHRHGRFGARVRSR